MSLDVLDKYVSIMLFIYIGFDDTNGRKKA